MGVQLHSPPNNLFLVTQRRERKNDSYPDDARCACILLRVRKSESYCTVPEKIVESLAGEGRCSGIESDTLVQTQGSFHLWGKNNCSDNFSSFMYQGNLLEYWDFFSLPTSNNQIVFITNLKITIVLIIILAPAKKISGSAEIFTNKMRQNTF